MTLRERHRRITPELTAEYYRLGAWREQTYLDLFNAARSEHGGQCAVVDRRRQVTFAELGDAVDAAMSAMAEVGVVRGSVLGVECVNEAEFVVAHLAASALGAVTLSLPASLSREAMVALLAAGDADALVSSAALATGLRDELSGSPLTTMQWDHDELMLNPTTRGAGAAPVIVSAPDDDAVMMPTAGTTGTPKLALRTQNSWLAMGRKKLGSLGDAIPTRDESTLILSPVGQGVGYIHGMVSPLLIPGLRRILMGRFRIEDALDLIEAEAPAVVVGVPAQLMMLMGSPTLASRDLGSIRYVQTGGDHMSPDKRQEFEQHFQAPVLIDYGASDVGAACAVTPADPDEKRLGTCGRPMRWTDVRIIADGRQVQDGTQGEVELRGPDLISGYYPIDDHDPSADFFSTGDLGHVDSDGYLVITGRMKDVIIRGGLNISPSSIEDALAAWTLLKGLAVAGIPDPILGQRIAMFCVATAQPQAVMDGLADWLEASALSRQQWPEIVYFIQELPLSPGGKVRKAKLLELVESGELRAYNVREDTPARAAEISRNTTTTQE